MHQRKCEIIKNYNKQKIRRKVIMKATGKYEKSLKIITYTDTHLKSLFIYFVRANLL